MTAPQTLFGMKIMVAAQYPKMVLAEDCPVTPEFRKEINEWMREFFGTTCLVPEDQALVFNGVTMLHPTTYAKLRAGHSAKVML